MKEYYQKLGLEEGASLEEVEKRYHKLLHEFNPENQEGYLKDIFKAEYDNIKDVYNKILGNFSELKGSKKQEKEDIRTEISVEEKLDLVSLHKQEGTYMHEQELNFEEVSKENDELVENKIKYSWWAYDEEYISGWQYFWRQGLAFILCFILVGIYLLSVTSFKRARSLGNSRSTCQFFAVWGFLSIFMGFIPGVNLINMFLHWYLWFSNGPTLLYTPSHSRDNRYGKS